MLYTAETPTPFAVSAAPHRTVLSARSPADAVVAETDARGVSSLHLLRASGNERIVLAAPESGWFESPDGAAALLLPRVRSGASTIRWFVRDGAGWHATDREVSAAQLRDACVARNGTTALLTGPEPRLVVDRTRVVSVRTDLPIVSECALGEQGGAVVARSFSPGGYRTDVRGIGLDGGQRWSRGYDSEAAVATDPTGERTAIAHDGALEVVNAAGQVIRGEPDAVGVRFTAEGELVVVTAEGTVRWLS